MPAIRMSPATRLFLAGNTVSMLGTGLVIAFILIYLHQVRGVALPVVGGLVFTLLVVIWLTSAYWFFSTFGIKR